jgi:serine/threonine protein phosphatase PrpC
MRIIATGRTDIGRQRAHNEDNFVVVPEHHLYVVADGMGGHRAGDVASRLAVDTIADFFHTTSGEDATWPVQFDPTLTEAENKLVAGIRLANSHVWNRGLRARDLAGMGTTVVGAHYSARDGRVIIGHVGDSRAYRVRDGLIVQLTVDHSLFNECMASMPDLTQEQQDDIPKNVITRALGMGDQIAVALTHDPPQTRDVYLLCSDGLSGMVDDAELLAIVTRHLAAHVDSTADIEVQAACDRAAEALIQAANENGGEDNITAVVLCFRDERPREERVAAGSEREDLADEPTIAI